MRRWKAPPHAVYESWSVVLPDLDAGSDLARDDLASGHHQRVFSFAAQAMQL
jgi:hypothetical protein